MIIARFNYQLVGGWYQPMLPVGFSRHKETGFIRTLCLVDTGAYMTLLDAALGEALGLKVTRGTPRSITGVGGEGVAYQHQLYLKVKSKTIQLPVLFTKTLNVNIIGRWPFFDYFTIIFNQKGKTLWLIG